MNVDRQSLMLLAVGIVAALALPWLLLDRRVRTTPNGAFRADVRPPTTASFPDAAVR
jgi:hypothetical protein